jgi:hypothetical protein
VGTLPELVGRETVAGGGEGFYHVLEGVGGGEVGLGVEVCFYVCDLGVEGFGDEEVGAVAEVFEETLCLMVSGGFYF